MIKRYCEQKFIGKEISTIGVDYGLRGVAVPWEGRVLHGKANFWDLSGRPEFLQVRMEFYAETHAVGLTDSHFHPVHDLPQAMLVFDVTSRRSFASLEQWLEEQAK